jgi:hypothetical protein
MSIFLKPCHRGIPAEISILKDVRLIEAGIEAAAERACDLTCLSLLMLVTPIEANGRTTVLKK